MVLNENVYLVQCNCTELKLIDDSEYDGTLPTKIEIKIKDITLSYDYTPELILKSKDFLKTVNYKDGAYDIEVKYKDLSNVYFTKIIRTFITCNIQYKVDSFIYDILDSDCTSCKKEKIKEALDYQFYLEVLNYSIVCSDFERAQIFLESLENNLMNYNCKNC
jgi:hypothetical protein